MSTAIVDRDERTIAIENSSYRLAYQFTAFGVLAIVAYRSFVLGQSSWDLLALIVVSGIVSMAFRGRQRAVTGSAAKSALFAAIGGIIVAALLAYGAQAAQAVRGGYRAAQQAADSAR